MTGISVVTHGYGSISPVGGGSLSTRLIELLTRDTAGRTRTVEKRIKVIHLSQVLKDFEFGVRACKREAEFQNV